MKVTIAILALLLVGCQTRQPENIQTRESHFPSGVLSSRYQCYADPNGNEILHGRQYLWNKDGMSIGYRTYDNGVLSGESLILSPNGDKRTYIFQDGKANGLARAWYSGGQRMYEMNFEDDAGDGTSESWSRDGKYHGQGEYKNNEPFNGTFVMISVFSTYSNGVMVSSEVIPKESR